MLHSTDTVPTSTALGTSTAHGGSVAILCDDHSACSCRGSADASRQSKQYTVSRTRWDSALHYRHDTEFRRYSVNS